MTSTQRLILHIGAGKTGSSAIQAWLRNNREQLIRNGVLIPDDKLGLNGPFTGEQISFIQNLSSRAERAEVLMRRFRGLKQGAREQGCHTVLVSAENLCHLRSMVPALAAATRGFERQVVFYVRRQDDFLLSGWQQWWLKCYASLPEYLDDAAERLADWNKIVRPWEAMFGRKAVVVRAFRRDKLEGGDAVKDFLSVTGLPSADCKPLTRPANSSFDEHVGDLAHRVRDLFDSPHDNDFYWRMIELLGPSVFKSRRGSHLLTLDERLALMARFDEGNDALRNRYYPDWGGAPLFDPPTAQDVVTLTEEQKLAAENAILTRAVVRLAERMNSMEQAVKTARVQ